MSGELPEGWMRTTVGALGEYLNGMAFKPADWEASGRPIIRIQNLSGSNPTFNYTTREVADRYVVPTGSLLVSWSATLDAFIWDGPEAVLNQHIFKVVGNPKVVDARFHYWMMKLAIDEMKRSAHLHGSTMKHINRGPFLAHEVLLPPLNEQRRIVAKLDALQSHSRKARAALDAIPTLLDRFRQSVLAAAFRGDLTADWRAAHPDVEPASALLDRIRVERKKRWIADYIDTMTDRARKRAEKKGKPWTDADDAKARKGYAKKAAEKYEEPAPVDAEKEGLPELPEGWCWARLPALLSGTRTGMKTGPFGTLLKKSDHRETGIPILGIENIGRMEFLPGSKVHISPEKARELQAYNAAEGDLLVSRSGTVGEVCVVPPGLGPARISTNVIRVCFADNGVETGLLGHAFTGCPQVLNQVRQLCSGSSRDFLNQTIMARLILPLPPLAEQRELLARLGRTFQAVRSRREAADRCASNMDTLDQSILAKAFRGELVPQDPTDEPAADLLARIQSERGAKKG